MVAGLTGTIIAAPTCGWSPCDPQAASTINRAPANEYVLGIKNMLCHLGILFFPFICLLAWSMHVAGAAFLARHSSRFRRAEVVTLTAHARLYVGILTWILGPWSALLVILLHKAAGGFYLATVFAPNHKGMLEVAEDSDLDFLRAQVLTSRNIRGNRVTDFWYGSLNYQVEHHLFPSMARNNVAGLTSECEQA